MADEELKRREEQKRERAYDPALRWKHIQETITWAEANLPPEQRRNRPRVDPSQRGKAALPSPRARERGKRLNSAK